MSHPYTIDELLTVKTTLTNMYTTEHGKRVAAESAAAEERLDSRATVKALDERIADLRGILATRDAQITRLGLESRDLSMQIVTKSRRFNWRRVWPFKMAILLRRTRGA